MINLPLLNPYLSFFVPPLPSPLPPPPPGTVRHLIGPEHRQIEILQALSPTKKTNNSPIILQHGGFGSAECYKNVLPELANRGYDAYAISLRGHGYSWRPSFFRMLCTTQHTLAKEDLTQAVAWIGKREACGGTESFNPIVGGHSAGGGLVQYALAQGFLERAKRLILIASFPPSGGFSIYYNWMFLLDPWAIPRLCIHFFHPRSPLSTLKLLKAAFFSRDCPMPAVESLASRIPICESIMWSSGMVNQFASDTDVVARVEGGPAGVMVVAGGEDQLMKPEIMKQCAAEYGGRYEEVRGSGHHIMLDSFWEACVDIIVDFLEDTGISRLKA